VAVVIEVVTAVLVGLLALVTVLAAYLGILGMVRAIKLTRCEFCGHFEVRPANLDDRCARAGRVNHVVDALHHVHVPRALAQRHH
jgi:hypothetical protein